MSCLLVMASWAHTGKSSVRAIEAERVRLLATSDALIKAVCP